MKELKTVWILGALFLGLLLYILIFELPKERYDQGEKQINEPFLTQITSSDISKIEISKGESFVTLEKDQNNSFIIKEQENFPASPELTISFLENVTNLKTGTKISANKEKHSQFGVTQEDSGRIKLFNDEQEIANIIVGNQGSNGGIYMRKEGSDDVFLIKTFLSSDLVRTSENWRDMTILTFKEQDLSQVVLKNNEKKVDYSKKEDGKWQKDGVEMETSDDFTNLLTELRSLKAYGIESSKEFSAYNLEDGKEEIKIYLGLQDSISKTLLIQKKDELYYARNLEKNVIYQIAESTVEKIKKAI